MGEMTKKERLALLKEWNEMHDNLDKSWHQFIACIGTQMVESPLWTATWRIFEKYTEQLGIQLGTYGPGWLNWYCYENEMGASQKLAGYDKIRPIRNLRDLERLIREGTER